MRKQFAWNVGVAIVLSCWLTGCSWKTYGIFINDTDQPLNVSVIDRDQSPERVLNSVVVMPGASVKSEIRVCSTIEVAPPGKALMYEHTYPMIRDPSHSNRDTSGPAVFHYLLTRSGLYPIPRRYWEDWGRHRSEIMNAAIDWLRCTPTR